jgi:hypothetical protein
LGLPCNLAFNDWIIVDNGSESMLKEADEDYFNTIFWNLPEETQKTTKNLNQDWSALAKI